LNTRGAEPHGTVAVAYSAGRDSTALLHATAHAAAAFGLAVVALHVHHGLMPQADDWLAIAERQIGRWRKSGLPVRLVSTRLIGAPAQGDSVEAWARRERRSALARMARDNGAGVILLAQHRRDQAETVLLQALRGAGPAGLAAMPRAVRRDGILWLRPWLDQPHAAIQAYLRAHRLRSVDDPSNADARFARSRLRQQVWPALTAAFPDAEQTLAAVARHAQRADALLAEVATADLARLGDGDRLRVPDWRALSAARGANVLRAWLHDRLGRGAPDSLIERLLADLLHRASGRWPVDAAHYVALYRGLLRTLPVKLPVAATRSMSMTVDLSRPGLHALPQWGGAIEVRRATQGGVPASALRACELRGRRGGERFQQGAGGTPRSLKKQFQSAGVAAWERDGPLVWADGRLLFVPGLGVDARWLDATRGAGLHLRWRPDA
jgi:tRNA(Ile)-lysidine synthase